MYYAWWELYLGPSNSIGRFSVTPGVTRSAEVKYHVAGVRRLALRTKSTGADVQGNTYGRTR